ncbi:MAG: DUF1415 domain-containing protein [Hylemonella sp.]|nr:DUF1415 domain-containing protein [Hylemonella sp.]
MQIWLERAVIGLNLCPFAKSVHVKGQIHWVVSPARDVPGVQDDLVRELQDLQASDPAQRDTTLLVLPMCFGDFLDFNDFLAQADVLLKALGLRGELQIASFHPQFQFAGTDADDIANYTNRSPYPTLHLLREASIDRAVEVFPEAESIYEKNMQVLEQLGHEGWDALGLGRLAKDVTPEGGAGGTP